MKKQELLLHSCCAPCSPYIIWLLSEYYDLSVYFYNPNIHPDSEYTLRLNEIKRLCESLRIPLHIGEYDKDLWFYITKGMENEPEKGARCGLCFQMRLNSTFLKASELSISTITTTLTVSPHKDSDKINKIGSELAIKHNMAFMEANFKKQNGYQKTNELAKKYNFYRQSYCGCAFSQKQKTRDTRQI